MQYSISVSSFQPNEDIFRRLDGTVAVQDGDMALCELDKCVRLEVPFGVFLEPGRRVMVEGHYRDGRLVISRVLRRCDHPHGRSE